jgi:predicted nucleotidyltransferase
MMQREDVSAARQLFQQKRESHRRALIHEVERLKAVAQQLGVERIVLFGSLARGEPGLTTDLDLLIVWDTSLGFLERTVEMYRRLRLRVPADVLVYTPAEMEQMIHTPLVRQALAEGRVLYEA